MESYLLPIILSFLAVAISTFSMGYSMANWHFSNNYVQEKVASQLEKELRRRLQLKSDITETTREATETIAATMDK